MSAAKHADAAMALPIERPSPWHARYAEVRARTLSLVAPLSPEDCALQSMPDASPAKWHLAHTTWFFETFVVAPRDDSYRPFDPAFRVLFNSYYNGIGDKHPRPERGLISRPSLDDVRAYRAHVDAAMRAVCEMATSDASLAPLIELGLNHEEQHQELILTDILHLMSRNPTHPVLYPSFMRRERGSRPIEWIAHPSGVAHVGHAGSGFAFDNESPRHRVWLDAFELASRPVTNAEYCEFIDDGGYRRPELWLSLGWDTVIAQGWACPMYWRRGPDGFRTYTLRGLVDLDPQAPLTHVSLFEADAYARWAGARLPTEFEWEAVMTSAQTPSRGDVWEWTSSSYAPYPGFRIPEGAIGEYNGKFMCNQYVLRGGSLATPPLHARVTYRNFFPADARWQFSGIRLARDIR
jgi:ergothioneine biosynthesis protein EgtB